MKTKINTALIAPILLFAFAGCNNKPPTPKSVENISTPPPVTQTDKKYANVFSMLDGKWEGVFSIYEDSLGQHKGNAQPEITENLEFAGLALRPIQEIEVRQEYVSESPYFQRVIIHDTYTDENGKIRTVESRGVNKVQDGHLWCIVKKPDETVIHYGKLDGPGTIIWQRDERNPVKIEYFRETVEDDYYKIIGWGYYEGDDPNLTPRLWFVGDYSKVDEFNAAIP